MLHNIDLIKSARGIGPAGPACFRDARDAVAAYKPAAARFLFSPSQLDATARHLTASFPGFVTYAVKANGDARVIAILAAAGIGGFDVASVAEIAAVASAAPGARMHYHNPVKSSGEIAEAYLGFGVRRFSADDAQEIAKILAATGNDPSVEVAVRFRLPASGAAVHDFASKFGATPEAAGQMLAALAARGRKTILTFHPGSQCRDPQAYARHIHAAAAIAVRANVRLEVLNVGGGFPVPYAGFSVPGIAGFCRAIGDAARSAFADVPALECEPGRALVASAVSLLAPVKLVKVASREVYIAAGLYNGLMEVAQAAELAPPHRVMLPCGDVRTGETAPFTVYGPTCDPLDRLPRPIALPLAIADGDVIEFGQLGAYAGAVMTNFNGYAATGMTEVARVLTC